MTALFLEAQNNSSNEDFFLLIGIVQFIVGVVQVFGAFCRTIYALINGFSLKLLGIYWLVVLLYFIILNFLAQNNSSLFVIWIGVAWLIAIWYCKAIVFNAKRNIDYKL